MAAPAFDDNTLDVVNRSAATIDIIEQAGDLSGIDEAAIVLPRLCNESKH